MCIIHIFGRKEGNKTQTLIHYGFSFLQIPKTLCTDLFENNTSLDFPSRFFIELLTENLLFQKNAASLFKLNILISLLLI